jgi:kynurenine formamidase
MRWIVGGKAIERQAASTSQMGRFETELLASDANIEVLADMNGFNHPGLTPEAVDRLLQIAKQKKIRIGGTVIDNISTETGQTAKGEDEKRTNSLTAHLRLLQHDILMVENAANLDALSETAKTKYCTLVVGAIKVARCTGAQARVLALCQSTITNRQL